MDLFCQARIDRTVFRLSCQVRSRRTRARLTTHGHMRHDAHHAHAMTRRATRAAREGASPWRVARVRPGGRAVTLYLLTVYKRGGGGARGANRLTYTPRPIPVEPMSNIAEIAPFSDRYRRHATRQRYFPC